MAKFAPSGKRIWGTYYGGIGDEIVQGLTVTATGVYIAGKTNSSEDVVAPPSADIAFGGKLDALVVNLTCRDRGSGPVTMAAIK